MYFISKLFKMIFRDIWRWWWTCDSHEQTKWLWIYEAN